MAPIRVSLYFLSISDALGKEETNIENLPPDTKLDSEYGHLFKYKNNSL
jgi:hypothetical protein